MSEKMLEIADKVAGYYLYFTSHCIVEAMHVHASDSKLTEEGSAKFFVKNNGDSDVSQRGVLNEREIKEIKAFIKMNYKEMYRWLPTQLRLIVKVAVMLNHKMLSIKAVQVIRRPVVPVML